VFLGDLRAYCRQPVPVQCEVQLNHDSRAELLPGAGVPTQPEAQQLHNTERAGMSKASLDSMTRREVIRYACRRCYRTDRKIERELR